jgi:3-methyladenine DNA glycosylase/8-oxoguanine DNA glycosylase
MTAEAVFCYNYCRKKEVEPMRIQTSPEAMEYLKRKDGRLGAVIDRLGPIERQGNADLFSAVVRHIVGQQISTKAQQTVWTRLT